MTSHSDIVRRTRLPIPAQRRAAPRPQKSWAGLRAGQTLEALEPVLHLPTGSLWRVMETTNQGATLHCEGEFFNLVNRDWKKAGTFQLKRTARRAKETTK